MKTRLIDFWRKMMRNMGRTAPLLLLAALAGNVAWMGHGAKAQESVCASLATRVFDTYDVDELKRMLELARESGFSEEEVRQITVEDDEGNTINAFKVINDIERCRREETERLAAERARVYLTPHDIFKELDGGQKKDLKDLRKKLFSN